MARRKSIAVRPASWPVAETAPFGFVCFASCGCCGSLKGLSGAFLQFFNLLQRALDVLPHNQPVGEYGHRVSLSLIRADVVLIVETIEIEEPCSPRMQRRGSDQEIGFYFASHVFLLTFLTIFCALRVPVNRVCTVGTSSGILKSYAHYPL